MPDALTLKLEMDTRQLQTLVAKGRSAITTGVRNVATELWGNLRREAPVDQGLLAGSFQMRQVSHVAFSVFTQVRYALDVHTGRAPGEVSYGDIEPWAIRHGLPPGAIFRSISNEGTQPNPYIDRAMVSTESRVPELVEMALKEMSSGS